MTWRFAQFAIGLAIVFSLWPAAEVAAQNTAAPASFITTPVTNEYRLGAGDVLRVSV